ncbi:MAG: site-specific DNA-methyltransferase [Leptospiraceae bacterium]|nr:site-specific DNA-methyltransferase [Leptospiraceae bacterium]
MYRIIEADVYAGIDSLENESIDIAITSPPYWGQRDYGIEGQIGNEPTYIEYISKLVKIFHLLKEKMTSKGVFYLNIGDKYLHKYGKTPLGMIPYKLAYFMVRDGWVLNDILIWYKPNHMPSSVKNRFTNSYEPIFVFSKSEKNYFSIAKEKNPNYSNILKVNLQPTPFKHVAVYPEKLVLSVFNLTAVHENMTILDMFSGSGTTLKVVKDWNESFESKNLNAVVIEKNPEYIEIIKERCLLTQLKVEKLNYRSYDYEILKENLQISATATIVHLNPEGFRKIFQNRTDYFNFIKNLAHSSFQKQMKLNATCFIGTEDFDINLIYETSKLNNNGWIIRNMLAIQKERSWYPIFMIVGDNKKEKYIFQYEKLNLKHKTEEDVDWKKISFVGMKTRNNLSKFKQEGTLVKVLETYKNFFPKYVLVEWEDGTLTKEFVIYSQEEINQNVNFLQHNGFYKVHEKIQIPTSISMENLKIKSKVFRESLKNYNGKFKEEKRINWGASPGARASNDEMYFSKQRLYDVEQQIVCDYLNYKRELKGYTKSEIQKFFPESYKHTVGHWFRKDFGGSIPLPEDWEVLQKFLELEEDWTRYVCKAGLKLQIVRKGDFKIPSDFLEHKFVSKLDLLIKK